MTAPRYLLLGEAPNHATATLPHLWLRPDRSGIQHSANRLLGFAGYTQEQYLATFQRDNIIHFSPPRAAKGYTFPSKLARSEAAARLAEHERDLKSGALRGIIVLGRRAASAFHWKPGFLMEDIPAAQVPNFQGAYLRSRVYSAGPRVHHSAAIIPHPSGMNQWWNDPTNRAQARTFFQSLLRGDIPC